MRERVMNESQLKNKDTAEEIAELRKLSGMKRREFCEYLGLPYRTLQDWELGNRHMPPYVLSLITYKVKMDKILEAKGLKEEIISEI